MKLQHLLSLVMITAPLVFVSCNKDDDGDGGGGSATGAVTKEFNTQFPGATNVTWTNQTLNSTEYVVASFLQAGETASGEMNEAWYRPGGVCYMTKVNKTFDALPDPVKTCFGQIADQSAIVGISELARKSMSTLYKVTVTQTKADNGNINLYISPKGILAREVPVAEDLDENPVPISVPDFVNSYIASQCPTASNPDESVAYYRVATQRYSVIAVADSIYLDLLFDTDKVLMKGTIRLPFGLLPKVVKSAYAIDTVGKILTWSDNNIKAMEGKNQDQVVTYTVPYQTAAGEASEFVCTKAVYNDLSDEVKEAYNAWVEELALEFTLTVNEVVTYTNATSTTYAIEAINDGQKFSDVFSIVIDNEQTPEEGEEPAPEPTV